MTLNRSRLRRGNSPRSARKSPNKRLNNTSLRKKALIKQLSSEVQFGNSSRANVKVVVRVRPENKRELEQNAKCVLKVVDEHLLVFDPKEDEDDFFFQGVRQNVRDFNKRVHKEQKFMFEHIFDIDSTNEQVYDFTTKDLIDTVLDGYNCSVFAYGATGAGKTFTMVGKPECPGITFLTVMALFERIEEIKEEKIIEVGVSYLEVYNESVKDLLNPGGKTLNVQENGSKVLVPGLSLHKPTNAPELMKMLAFGNHNRSQHPTDANADSSRSHAVFQVFVKQKDRTANVSASVALAKLSMIDLAGSERGSATGFKGARFREGANINKSLLALGNCINALADGLRHIPYRDSKLTRLLKDSLGGNCRSVMIAAVTRAHTSFEDTFNTLRYAERAKTIKTKLEKNIQNVDHHVTQYVKIVEDLREEIISLKEKIAILEENDPGFRSVDYGADGTFVAATPSNKSSQYINNENENRIALLEQQLEKAKNLPFVSEEEEECQRIFRDYISERKALRRELLQLESQERELQMKNHITKVHLARMKIVSFAAMRLDKSIAKCERSIRNLTIVLEQTLKRKTTVEAKVEKSVTNIRDLQLKLNEWGEDQAQPSKASCDLIEKSNNSLALRDSYHMTEYLKGLVKKSVSEQACSDKLVDTLLNACMKFYVRLKSTGQCTTEVEETFESVVEQLDESKVAWADQQLPTVEESKPEGVPDMPQLDISHLISLTISKEVYISPVVRDSNRVYKRSIMRGSTSGPLLPLPVSPGIPTTPATPATPANRCMRGSTSGPLLPGLPTTPATPATPASRCMRGSISGPLLPRPVSPGLPTTPATPASQCMTSAFTNLNTTTTLDSKTIQCTPVGSLRPSSTVLETPVSPVLSKFSHESLAVATPKCSVKQETLKPKILTPISESGVSVQRKEPVNNIVPLQSRTITQVNRPSFPSHNLQKINHYITPSKADLPIITTDQPVSSAKMITSIDPPVSTSTDRVSCAKKLDRSPENSSSSLGFLSMCPGSRAPFILPTESSDFELPCDNSNVTKSSDILTTLRTTIPVIPSNTSLTRHWLTKDSVEILEDISMPEISFNSTVSVTPAKSITIQKTSEENELHKINESSKTAETLSNRGLNTTMDLPLVNKLDKVDIMDSHDNVNCLNTTIDMPSTRPINLNTTVDISESILSNHQLSVEQIPSVGALNVTVDLGKPATNDIENTAPPNIIKPSVVPGKNRRSFTIKRAEDPCNQTFTMDDIEVNTPKSSTVASLDCTFSFDSHSDKANLDDLGITPLSPGEFPSRPLGLKNPSNIGSGIKGPTTIGSLMPPPNKTPITMSKKGTNQKSPTYGGGRGNVTPRGKSISGMRRSISTPTLAPQKVTSSQPSPNMQKNVIGLGGAIRRTSSFLNRKSGITGNEENVPPVSRLARPHQALSQRHMSASALPQAGNNVVYRQ